MKNIKPFGFVNNMLDEQSVNNFLIKVNSFATSNGFILINMGTNAVPTGDGLIAKTELQSRGWHVSVN